MACWLKDLLLTYTWKENAETDSSYDKPAISLRYASLNVKQTQQSQIFEMAAHTSELDVFFYIICQIIGDMEKSSQGHIIMLLSYQLISRHFLWVSPKIYFTF